jgi:hypothetical protein
MGFITETNEILNRKIIIPTTPFLIEIKGGGFLNVNSNNVDSMQMLLSYFIHKNYVTLALFYIKKERVTDIEKLKKSLDNDNAVYRYRTILTLNINEYLTSGKIYMSNNTQIIELIHNKKIIPNTTYDTIICSFDFKEELLKSLNKGGTLIIQTCKENPFISVFNDLASVFSTEVKPITADYDKTVKTLEYFGFSIIKEFIVKNKGLNPLDVRIIIAKK